jgi:hypothetical protein
VGDVASRVPCPSDGHGVRALEKALLLMIVYFRRCGLDRVLRELQPVAGNDDYHDDNLVYYQIVMSEGMLVHRLVDPTASRREAVLDHIPHYNHADVIKNRQAFAKAARTVLVNEEANLCCF